MQLIKAPDRDTKPQHGISVFLAGSIEMGKAVDWQKEVIDALRDLDVTVYNPRREDWDASWKQTYTNEQFRDQVCWEQEKLKEATLIFMYLAPGTQSPISLLEFGQFCYSGKLIVCCPHGFWRRGNIEVMTYCAPESSVPPVLCDDLEFSIKYLRETIWCLCQE